MVWYILNVVSVIFLLLIFIATCDEIHNTTKGDKSQKHLGVIFCVCIVGMIQNFHVLWLTWPVIVEGAKL